MQNSPTGSLKKLLQQDSILTMPCCFDPMSAKLVEAAGFDLSFMSGFSTAAARLGMPDTGLISYGEMVDQGRNINSAVSIPVIGDGDTGYGNALNVKRTVRGYAQAGFAGILIEDQQWPKRCGHTKGKQVVEFDEALARIRAAVDARDEGADILIMARTDARAILGLDEALRRAEAFAKAGADMLFVEAPRSEEEMYRICREVPGIHMANMVEDGETPLTPPDVLEEMGFRIVAYPLTLLSVAIKSMQEALAMMKNGQHPKDRMLSFAELRKAVGFDDYYDEEARYSSR